MFYRTMKNYFPILLVFSAAVFLSCTKQEKENSIAEQEKSIENYINTMSGKTTVKNSGTTRIIMDQGSGDVVAEKGDSIYFYYAGYVFESGKSSLFCTNRLATAEESGFQLTDPDYSIKKIRLGSGDLIPGLENGLEGVLKGEHSELVFSAKYGYYDKPAYNVPSLSALLFEIWITEIIKN